MSQKPPRSWFRFSLRSLLVVVTAVCIWLAWESSVVRGRRAVLNEMQAQSAFQFTTADEWARYQPAPGATPGPIARVSLIRRWLGDKAIQTIGYYPQWGGVSEADLKRLARYFPEAKLEEREIPLEPCHPGCFPRGTLVETTAGPRPIESIQPGDALVAVVPSGELITARVQSLFVTQNRLWRVQTEAGVLLTTETQPLCLAPDEFKPAGQLQPGNKVLRRVDGQIQPTVVLRVAKTDRIEQVTNLVLGDCEAFVANTYLARSKPPADLARE